MDVKYRITSTSVFDKQYSKIAFKSQSARNALAYASSVLSTDPFNLSKRYDIKKLSDIKPGEGAWRLRVRNWRIRYDAIGRDVVFYRFKDRKDAYK